MGKDLQGFEGFGEKCPKVERLDVEITFERMPLLVQKFCGI